MGLPCCKRHAPRPYWLASAWITLEIAGLKNFKTGSDERVTLICSNAFCAGASFENEYQF